MSVMAPPEQLPPAPLDIETFMVLNPDGSIDAVAGADAIEPPPANPRITCHNCRTLLEYSDG